jgi:secondary thiamine-phosphate synthase enzyme
MLELIAAAETSRAALKVHHHSIRLQTSASLQLIDLTERIAEIVAQAAIDTGLVNIQTRHTTTAIIVNEHEPLLLEDLKRMLERLAPADEHYRHDDFSVRTVNLTPEERPNGQAHCRAMLLRTSEMLNIAEGRLQLGRWQRVFFVELDGARERAVSIIVMGQAAEDRRR